MVKSLREIVKEAEDKKIAIGHFNISDTEGLWAIFNAAKNLGVPVVIGVSEGERDFIGTKQVAALVRSIREEFDYPIYLNADHTYSYERVVEAIDAGFDSVIFDGTKLSMEENINMTRKCVEYAKNSGRDVLVEAEIGYIGSSSKILDEIPEGAEISDDKIVRPEDAKRFVEETGVDMIAPAVGNIHGMLRHASNPNLSIERIREIREACGVPLVLHGGSGLTDENFVNAIDAGISTVHINTEIRRAYRQGIQKYLSENPEEIAPYRFMKEGLRAMQDVVENRLRLFNKI